MSARYKIIRFSHGPAENRVIKTDLTLEEAQEHCEDPETSSRTCSKAMAEQEKRDHGSDLWFDGYTEQ
jgi:hypothetical protein